MRSPSQDLYELIRTLNPAEVNSCRKRMRDPGSDIRRLFEAMLDQEVYDEAVCRAATGKDWTDNQWSVAKNYLHHSIMGALMHRRRNEMSAWNVRTHLQYLEILYGKELYRQCRKKLEQVARTVDKLDDPVLRNEVLQWRYRLHSRNYHRVPGADFEALHADFLANKVALEEYLHAQYLHQQFLYVLRNRGLIQDRGMLLQAFQRVMEDPLLQPETEPVSLATRLLRDHLLGTWAFLQGRAEESFGQFERVVEEMESRKGWQLSHPELYFGALYWYSIAAIETYRFGVTDRILQRMDRMRADSPYNKARLFYYKSQLARSRASLLGDAEENLRIARQILRDLPGHESRCQAAEVVNLQFNTGLSFLFGESPEEAVHCFLQVLQQPVLRELPEYELATKVLLLLFCLETGDRDWYRHYRRSLKRWLSRRPGMYPLEETVLEGLGHFAAARNEEDQRLALLQLQGALGKLEDMAVNRYFDFDIWIRSRLGEGGFRELYQAEVGKGLAERGE